MKNKMCSAILTIYIHEFFFIYCWLIGTRCIVYAKEPTDRIKIGFEWIWYWIKIIETSFAALVVSGFKRISCSYIFINSCAMLVRFPHFTLSFSGLVASHRWIGTEALVTDWIWFQVRVKVIGSLSFHIGIYQFLVSSFSVSHKFLVLSWPRRSLPRSIRPLNP